nr:putative integron gene cassette protein [uncultured bacterium]CAP48906.1 putative integron gene cassette protein [uncultured bacterium]
MHGEGDPTFVSPGIYDHEVHLIPTYEHRFLRLVLCVMPTGGSQFPKEVDGVVPRLSPNQPLRPRKHDVRKVEFTIHSVCVASVEEGSEPIETLRGSMYEIGVEFL